MKIGVIISTYNSPEWLDKVLAGYAKQSYRNFEIVVADDGSTSETAKLIRKHKRENKLAIKHVWHEDERFRKWKIVNQAISESTAEYLLFTDGDCIPHPDLLAVHAREAEQGKFLSGGYCRLTMETSEAISVEDIDSGDVFKLTWLLKNGFGLNLKWLKVLAPGTFLENLLNRITPAKKTFNGNNSSCFRDDVLCINGFDERILYGGGDREFGYRLENFGVAPKVIRYSTLCLHLDHPRGYKDPNIRAANLEIIDETRAHKRVTTEYGIVSPFAINEIEPDSQ